MKLWDSTDSPKGVAYQLAAPVVSRAREIRTSEQDKIARGTRTFLMKTVGFNPTLFDGENGGKSSKTTSLDLDDITNRHPKAFSPVRSPRRIFREAGLLIPTSEVLRGQGLPATPRLLRGGDSKTYGIRRQISSGNQLELSPDIVTPGPGDPGAHFNTPCHADAAVQSSPLHIAPAVQSPPITKPPPPSAGDPLAHDTSLLVITPPSPRGDDLDTIPVPVAITNRLTRERPRDAPWVYCYKVKRDRLKLSNLLVNRGVADPAIEQILPAF